MYAMLPPKAASASVARELVICACHDWGMDGFIDDLTLVVTELVANAVRHAGTPMEVRLINLEGGIRLEVQDFSTRPLRPRPSSLIDEGGRGLMLVDALASPLWRRGRARGQAGVGRDAHG